MSLVVQIGLGFAMIAGLLAIQALALYVIWWVVLRLVAFLPMIGKKHRHQNWERLNRPE